VLDVLAGLPPASAHMCVTSPPYWGLRDYGVDGQIGLEETPQAWVDKMVLVSKGLWRVLRDDATWWLNVGDSYSTHPPVAGQEPQRLNGNTAIVARETAIVRTRKEKMGGLPEKNLMLMPFRLALALQDAGWYVRSDICWAKKSPMPESVTDRPTSAWEHIFLLSKSAKYYYDAEAVRQVAVTEGDLRPTKTFGKQGNADRNDNGRAYLEGSGANLRNVWHLGPEPYPLAHFATFVSEIPRRAIKAGTSEKGVCAECGAPWQRVVEHRRATYTKVPDPTPITGRRGMNRDRPGPSDTYVLGITQSALAGMLREAANGRVAEMEAAFGSKWAHWTRTDDSGARVPTFEDAKQIKALLGVDIPFDGQPAGWQAGCECEADVIPATVLDPFMGSGTTAAVAQNLRRRWIGIELNKKYCELSATRIQNQAAQRQLAI